MKKLLVIPFLSIFLSGCGYVDNHLMNYTDHLTICVDGVNYVQFKTGASVKYNADGTISTCKS